MSLNIMSKRTSLPNHTQRALEHLIKNSAYLEKESTLLIHAVTDYIGI